MASETFKTKSLPKRLDHIAPDGSEIRMLVETEAGGLAHCTLPPGKISAAVYHNNTVDELWNFLSGEREIWRRNELQEEIVQVRVGVGLSIPRRTAFQFRNTGIHPLYFVIVTIPPWPGPDEAVATTGKWITSPAM